MRSLFAVASITLALFYQSLVFPRPAVAADAAAGLSCRDPSSTLLWRVTGKHSRVYLFGSIHVGKADFYPLPAVIENAFRQARYIVFEVDPQDLKDPTVIANIQADGTLPEGEKLSDVISPPVLQKLDKTLSGLGLPADSFMHYRPWFITMLLSNLQMASMGYMSDEGIENYLMREKPPQAQVLQLESVQKQIGFMQQLNGEAFLSYTLMDFNKDKEAIQQLVDAWRCADQGQLHKLLFNELKQEATEDPSMKDLMNLLFFKRDKTMAATIRGYLDHGRGDYFIVVGAGHLIGPGSIIDILKDSYKVVNIKKSN